MKFAETKKEIDKIRNRDEGLFRMAISHLMDVGIRPVSYTHLDVYKRQV